MLAYLSPWKVFIHPVFYALILCKHDSDSIVKKHQPEPKHVEVNVEEESEVADILNYKRQHKNL